MNLHLPAGAAGRSSTGHLHGAETELLRHEGTYIHCGEPMPLRAVAANDEDTFSLDVTEPTPAVLRCLCGFQLDITV